MWWARIVYVLRLWKLRPVRVYKRSGIEVWLQRPMPPVPPHLLHIFMEDALVCSVTTERNPRRVYIPHARERGMSMSKATEQWTKATAAVSTWRTANPMMALVVVVIVLIIIAYWIGRAI